MKEIEVRLRTRLLAGVGGVATLGWFPSQTAFAGEQSAPCPACSVVWITMDTTRADRMGFLGNASGLTPNLDSFATNSRIFQNAYSHAPETLQSVSAFFSGRYRANNGMDFDLAETSRYHTLSPDLTTVAEAFRGAGYATVGFNANPVIAQGKSYSFGLNQGFDRWEHGDDAAMTAAAVDYLAGQSKSPTFVYVQLMGPHADNERLDGFESRRGTFDSQVTTVTQKFYEDVAAGRNTATTGDQAYMRAMYDDAIWQMDQRVGSVLDAVKASKSADHSIVVIDADHGEGLGEPGTKYPRFGHGHALSNELLHVPLIIGGHGVERGKDEQVAELVDVGPTLCGLTGIAVDTKWRWDGQPLTGPGAMAGTTAISERAPWESRQIGARTPQASFLYTPNKGWVKAYDLLIDPLQQTPATTLTDAQKALQTLVKAYLAGAHPPASKTDTKATDAEIEMLKALGYTQ